jgi:hypothetical protein
MFGEIFRSLKKSSTIRKLTKEYLNTKVDLSSGTIHDILTADTIPRDNVINKIVEMAYNEPNNQPPVKKFKITRVKLAETISHLERLGCGQYAKGHYVAISSILYPQTLEYIFYKNRKNLIEKERMAIDLINYFAENNTGNIVDIDYD